MVPQKTLPIFGWSAIDTEPAACASAPFEKIWLGLDGTVMTLHLNGNSLNATHRHLPHILEVKA